MLTCVLRDMIDWNQALGEEGGDAANEDCEINKLSRHCRKAETEAKGTDLTRRHGMPDATA